MEKTPKKKISKIDIIPKTPEMFKFYCSYMKPIFENINYYISKKNPYYQEIYDKSESYLKKVESDYELNGDKYIPIIIKSLFTENYKLAKNVLPNLSKLIKNNFILGKTNISLYKKELPSDKDLSIFSKENIFHKKIIDLLIIILTYLDEIYQDEDIWIFIIECIREIVHNKHIIKNIKDEPFEKIYIFYFRVYNKFEDDKNNQQKIKEDLYYFIDNTLNEFSHYYCSDISILSKETKIINNNSYSLYLKHLYNKLGTSECIDNVKNKNYNPIDLLVCRTVKIIVDTICYREKVNNYNDTYNEDNSAIITPLIPRKESDFYKMTFRYVKSPDISNEYVYQSGFFGWCYICRKTASYYCINHFLPICGFACKGTLSQEEEQINNLNSNLIKDGPKMLIYFSNILSNKKFFPHHKNMVFELIRHILEKYGDIINKSKSFVKVIKENLIEGLIKTSLSKDINLFIPAINLFFEIWKLFRENLKREISYFNENILIKILNSSNASFLHKKIVLENFSKRDFFYYMELYINYDCDLVEKMYVSNLISTFCDIIKGRYNKNIKTYSEKEYSELNNYTLKILTLIIKTIWDISKKLYSKKSEKENMTRNNFFTDRCWADVESDENYENNMKILSNKNLNKMNNSFNNSYSDIYEKKGIYDNKINEINEETIIEILNQKPDSNLRKKYELKIAAEKFNLKIKSGLSYLKTIGYINTTSINTEAKDINFFIHNTPSLSKKCIGEFLGENTELSMKVLEYFVDNFNFKNLHIIESLRVFLSTFELPKEGQKIYRILEFFSYKYIKDNPNKFNSSEIVFYLSYAIIILQAELHNPNIKEKMDINSFIKLFEIQNNIKNNLSKEFLTDIYLQIEKEPISLIGEDKDNIKDTKDEYIKEKKRIINDFKLNYKNKVIKYKEVPYTKLKKGEIEEYLPQFVLSVWKPFITTYRTIIQESNDENIYKNGIYGMVYCIQIFGLIGLDRQKQTVIALICFMTNLFNIKPIKEKNCICIKQILSLAHSDYRYCKGGWDSILEIINKLHYYYLLYTMPKEEKIKFLNNKFNNNSELIKIVKDNINVVPKIFTPNDYEKILNKVDYFDCATFIEFLECMCEISKRQFKDNEISKIFFLQKIVETAENNLFNNKKININQIWKILQNFFTKVGVLANTENANTCIDSLRQLVSKFLQKKECNKLQFQPQLFRAFLQIINESQNNLTKEYIFSCVNNLVKSHTDKIKYGWIIVINIYKELSSINGLNNIKMQTLDILLTISNNYFHEINNIFSNFISCLKAYIPQYPVKAFEIINIISKKLNIENNYRILLKIYTAFLLHEDEEIRNKSLADFMNLISKEYISSYNFLSDIYKKESFWKLIFQEILFFCAEQLAQKISEFGSNNNSINSVTNIVSTISTNNISFNDSSTDLSSHKSMNTGKNSSRSINNEKIKHLNSLHNLLLGISNIFNDSFSYNAKELSSFFQLLDKIIFCGDEKLQKTGFECVKYLFNIDIIKNASFLQSFISFLISLANKSSGKQISEINIDNLKNKKNTKNMYDMIDKYIFLSYIHYSTILLLDSSIPKYMKYLSSEELNKIIECLNISYNSSMNFNSKIDLRLAISDFMKINSTINLFQQLQISVKNYFYLLEQLYYKNENFERKQELFQKILNSSEIILNEYISKDNEYKTFIEKNENCKDDDLKLEGEFQEWESLLLNYSNIICEYIFPLIQKIEFFKNDKCRDNMVNIIFKLIMCYQPKIREKIKDILKLVFQEINKPKEKENDNEKE